MILIGKIKDITGQQFGRLTALYPEYKNGKCTGKWICKCKCGNITPVKKWNLTSGNTKSCSCLFKERGSVWYYELPEYDVIIFVCKNDPLYFFIADMKDLHLLDEFAWTALSEGKRVKPVTWIKGDPKKRYLTFGQKKLNIAHGDSFECDHINHLVNDFRSCNIRRATENQNKCNNVNGVGQIKKDADGYYLVFPDAYTSEKFVLPERYATKAEAEAAKIKWLDDSADYHDFTYWNSQRIAKEHALHYNSWPTFIVGKRAETVEEIRNLPETNLFKFLLRRYHGWMLDLADGRTIKSGGYEICGIVVNGREMPLDEATCYDKMLEIITEYEKFKTTEPKDQAV